MIEIVAERPSRTIRIFSSHREQEEQDLRYWRDQTLEFKLRNVAELAEYFAYTHKIDLDAQGPKRIAVRVQRS